MDGCILCSSSRSHQLVAAKARCFYNPLLLFSFFFFLFSFFLFFWDTGVIISTKLTKLFSSQTHQLEIHLLCIFKRTLNNMILPPPPPHPPEKQKKNRMQLTTLSLSHSLSSTAVRAHDPLEQKAFLQETNHNHPFCQGR